MLRRSLGSRSTRSAVSLTGALQARCRCYATPTSSSVGARSGKASAHDNSKQNPDKYTDSPWRKPLASTQTMSLFSTSAPALLFAVEQSLRGAMGALVKADPQGGHSTDPRDYLLLFAIDKTLPSDVLAETTRLFRDIPIPHVGVLSAPVPGTLLPESATSDASAGQAPSPQTPPPFYHSVSLSLLPATLAQPFYSDIPGVAPIKAGRWASGKPAFDETQSRVGHLDEQGDAPDWRSIWGKENLTGKLPDEMSAVDPASHLLTLILGSDGSPQGLLEGVDSQFAQSPLLGSLASNTVFETGGRDATMFYRGKVDRDASEGKKASQPADENTQARIFSKGAVGLYLRTPSQEKLPSNSTRARPSVDLEMPWKNFLSLGGRREITRAKGNIVSLLDDSNACQHFLRDVASRDRSTAGDDGLPTNEEDLSMEAKARGMSREEQRLLSKGVKKEENFWAAIWGQDEADNKPLLLARILSGHPSRGTISLDTDLELSTGLASTDVIPSASPKVYLEFYQELEPKPDEPDTSVEPLSIPGQDLAAWRLPRFLFVNHQKTDAVQGEQKPSSSDKGAKPAVHALPNLFVLSSESGLISRDPSLFNRSALDILRNEGEEAQQAKSATDVLQSRTATWKANGLKAWVDLRGRSS